MKILNCFILIIPILLWNIFLTNSLPDSYSKEIFWKDIPSVVGYSENILRVFIFGLPVIMILSLKSRTQRIGLVIYSLGVVIYFLSWIAVILNVDNAWRSSAMGFTAPAYTTIVWLIGIGLIGSKSYIKIPNPTLIYILLSVFFVLVHTYHAYIVFVNHINT